MIAEQCQVANPLLIEKVIELCNIIDQRDSQAISAKE